MDAILGPKLALALCSVFHKDPWVSILIKGTSSDKHIKQAVVIMMDADDCLSHETHGHFH